MHSNTMHSVASELKHTAPLQSAPKWVVFTTVFTATKVLKVQCELKLEGYMMVEIETKESLHYEQILKVFYHHI